VGLCGGGGGGAEHRGMIKDSGGASSVRGMSCRIAELVAAADKNESKVLGGSKPPLAATTGGTISQKSACYPIYRVQ